MRPAEAGAEAKDDPEVGAEADKVVVKPNKRNLQLRPVGGEPSILTYRQVTGQGAIYITGGGARLISALSQQHALGETSSHLNLNEGLTSPAE